MLPWPGSWLGGIIIISFSSVFISILAERKDHSWRIIYFKVYLKTLWFRGSLAMKLCIYARDDTTLLRSSSIIAVRFFFFLLFFFIIIFTPLFSSPTFIRWNPLVAKVDKRLHFFWSWISYVCLDDTRKSVMLL